jgi:aspartyl-tRNA synthetase
MAFVVERGVWQLTHMKRTHYCGDLRAENIGHNVVLYGWVHSRRDHGGVVFIDLRDREGWCQIVFQPEKKEIFASAEKLRSEFCIKIHGAVRIRPEGTKNPNLPTGEVEVVADNLEIISVSAPLPFEVSDYTPVSEEVRLRYRYLDLRRPNVQKNFVFRHKALQITRENLSGNGFLEIETPFLTKSTPEGARDFLVPSRLNHGSFFALPQSPQLFKQILMVAGFDKYFQVVKCFRDEDLRADRQPEFTQIDLEMSFVDENDVMSVTEKLVSLLFKELAGIEVKTPIARLSYKESMLRFGNDKPDTRFGMEIHDFTEELKSCGFKVFSETISKKGVVRAICAKQGSKFSRSEIDDLTKFVGEYGARGLAWMKATAAGFESNIVKFFKPEELEIIKKKLGAEDGDMVMFVADDVKVAAQALGALRLRLGKTLGLIDNKKFNFVWIVDFPLFEWDKELGRWQAMHHPFTSPRDEDLPLLADNTRFGDICARAYDIVVNGVELGGGSIRIHSTDVQKNIFQAMGISESDAAQKFGFLLDALKFGAPIHGGLALGFDRLCAMILGEDSIRDVIAFPKTQKAVDLMSDAPNKVSEKQLKELGIKFTEKIT